MLITCARLPLAPGRHGPQVAAISVAGNPADSETARLECVSKHVLHRPLRRPIVGWGLHAGEGHQKVHHLITMGLRMLCKRSGPLYRCRILAHTPASP